MDDRLSEDKVRGAHAQFDKTRCAAWLAATGNRPAGGISLISLASGEVAVSRVAQPVPVTCDIHPVEP